MEDKPRNQGSVSQTFADWTVAIGIIVTVASLAYIVMHGCGGY